MKDESAADPPLDQGSDPAQQAGEALTERRLVTHHRRVRRPLGVGYWLTALAVAGALVATTTYTQREGMERQLTAAVEKRLAARDIARVEVSVEGRSVTADVLAGDDAAKVERQILAVSGVAAVETTQIYASVKQREACQTLRGTLSRVTDGQRIPFVGETARLTRGGQTMVKAAARVLEDCPVGDVVVGAHSDEQTPDGAILSLERARLMVDLLERAGIPGSRLEARGYGAEFPVDEGDSAAARQRNQRGEITVEVS